MDEITIELPQVTLRALTWGPESGPLAILLHGFPDTASTWRHLGPALAEDGWRVVAPYLRGYAPSAVPADRCYALPALVSDVLNLHRILGGGQDAALVGHDWGAMTTSAVVAHEDSPFTKVAVLSVPPLPALRTSAVLRVIPRQLLNSWYAVFSLLPWLPERVHAPLVRRLWRAWSPHYDARDDISAALKAMTEPSHRRAVFGYYRALANPLPPPATYRRWKGAETKLPRVPILYLHGADDRCLDSRLLTAASTQLPVGSETAIVPGAGHFPHLERPEEVNRLVVEYLRG